MIFAILFILAFLVGLVSYLITHRWWVGVIVTSAVLIATTLADGEARAYWSFTLIFGLPIVAVASLLGAYVVELRRGVETLDNDDSVLESEHPKRRDTDAV